MGVRELEQEIEQLKSGLRHSFQRVKDDINAQATRHEQATAWLAAIEGHFSSIKEQLVGLQQNTGYNTAYTAQKVQQIDRQMNAVDDAQLKQLGELKEAFHAITAQLQELKERNLVVTQEIKERDLAVIQEINSVKSGIQNVVIGLYQKLGVMEGSLKEIEKLHEDSLRKHAEGMEKRFDELTGRITEMHETLKKMQESFASGKAKKESKLQQQMIKKIDKNKRGIIKQKIRDIVAVKSLTLPELKEIIVDENSYCSKASFYRYIEELQRRGMLEIVEVDSVKTIVLTNREL